jgi:hypothetical protein
MNLTSVWIHVSVSVVAESTFATDLLGAHRLAKASLGVSISGILVTVLIIVIVVPVIVVG